MEISLLPPSHRKRAVQTSLSYEEQVRFSYLGLAIAFIVIGWKQLDSKATVYLYIVFSGQKKS